MEVECNRCHKKFEGCILDARYGYTLCKSCKKGIEEVVKNYMLSG